jgi:hypothetical protein
VIIAVREFKKIKSIRQQIKIVEEIIFLSQIDKPYLSKDQIYE